MNHNLIPNIKLKINQSHGDENFWPRCSSTNIRTHLDILINKFQNADAKNAIQRESKRGLKGYSVMGIKGENEKESTNSNYYIGVIFSWQFSGRFLLGGSFNASSSKNPSQNHYLSTERKKEAKWRTNSSSNSKFWIISHYYFAHQCTELFSNK